MATTENLQLTKPDLSDNYDLSVWNENLDKIDNAYAKLPKSSVFINAKDYGLSPEKGSVENFDILVSIINTVNNAGGGTIYIPAGEYYLQNANNITLSFQNIRFTGDGMATKIRRYHRYPIFNVVGTSVLVEKNKHLANISFDNIWFATWTNFTDTLQPFMVFEAVSALRIINCKFSGNGTHIDMRELFDSKIIATDFDGGGRVNKSNTSIADATFNYNVTEDFDATDTQGCHASIIMRSGVPAQSGNNNIENTNQILFWGCRFESFRDGFLSVVGYGTNGIKFTNCKFESVYSTVPLVMMVGTTALFNFTDCYFYRPVKLYSNISAANIPIMCICSRPLHLGFKSDISFSGTSDVQMTVAPITISCDRFSGNEFTFNFCPFQSNGVEYLSSGVNLISSKDDSSLLADNIIKATILSEYGAAKATRSYMPQVTAAPTTGYHYKGQRIEFSEPDSEGYTEAICTQSGTAGVWKKINKITT